jgi:hypothetical protein
MPASGAANCPGVVHQPVDPSGRVEGGARDPAGGVLVAMIAREGERPAAVVGDLRAHGLEPIRTPADQDDGRAEVRQLVRRAAADPATATGDDVGLAGEQAGTEYRVEGHGLLPWRGVSRDYCAGRRAGNGAHPRPTLTTSRPTFASLLTGRPVRHTVGMTGEVTLQGRVLPIGGLKQKVLAAHAAGLTDVILPERNAADLDDVPEDVRAAMRFHPVSTLDEVLALALEPRERALAA